MGRKTERPQAFTNQVIPIKWSTMKATPKNIVKRIHFRAAALSPRLDADTPNTIVKLDDSRQNVMTDEKTMLG